MLLYGDIYIASVSSLKTYGHLDNLYFMGEISALWKICVIFKLYLYF